MSDAAAKTLEEARLIALDAEAHYARGRRDLAALYAGAAVEVDARAAPAWRLLARLALDVGRPGRAAAWLRTALEYEPPDGEARAMLAEAERRPPPAPPAGPRLLLIREWSAGFWSDVDHVLGMCLLAEITDRAPVVWWGELSRFRAPGGGNAWTQFFEPVAQAGIPDPAPPPGEIFPAKWRGRPLTGRICNRWTGDGSRLSALQFLDRPETLVVSDFHASVKAILPWLDDTHPLQGKPLAAAYRYLAEKYLRPRDAITAAVDRFARERFAGHRVLGVHVRGSDKAQEVADLDALVNSYFPEIDRRLQADGALQLFLLTDDTRVHDAYRHRYGQRIITTACTRTSSDLGVHFAGHAEPARLGAEVLVDTLLATRCDQFVGMAYSNVSAFVSYLKAWPPGDCLLLGPNVHEAWNVLLLEIPPPPGLE